MEFEQIPYSNGIPHGSSAVYLTVYNTVQYLSGLTYSNINLVIITVDFITYLTLN